MSDDRCAAEVLGCQCWREDGHEGRHHYEVDRRRVTIPIDEYESMKELAEAEMNRRGDGPVDHWHRCIVEVLIGFGTGPRQCVLDTMHDGLHRFTPPVPVQWAGADRRDRG